MNPGGNDSGLGAAAAAAGGTMGNNPVGSSSGTCPRPPAPPPTPPGPTPPGPTPPGPGPTPPPPPPPQRPPIGPVITVAAPKQVLVRKPYIPENTVTRVRVDLTVDDQGDPGGFNGGTLTVTQPGGQVIFFDAQTGGNQVSSFSFTSQALCQVVTIWAQGAAHSDAMDDVVLELSLSQGSRPIKPPVRDTLTAIEVTLDIFQSRTDPAVDPAVMPTPAGPPAGPPTEGALGDKISPGRFVHAQDTGANGFHHGRALLIVRKAAPANFPGTLELRSFDANVQLFADANELPANGQAVIPTSPHNLPNGGIPATGQRFWAEGVNPSGALGDTGFKLGVAGLGQDGDWAKMTVVRFTQLVATIPSTPPQPLQAAQGIVAANGPVVDDTLTIPNASVRSPYDETDANNKALVLVNGSIPAAKSVQVDATIVPNAAGPWVLWSVQRDTRPGAGDHADVIAASPNPLPTLTPDAANKLRATFNADAAGTFHIRPFIDCNGTTRFEHNTNTGARIDREPFIILNLILVHITRHDNVSRGSAAFVTIRPTPPTTATGIRVQTTNVPGAWVAATKNQHACYNNAAVNVIGGGQVGRNGLDRLFSGWINNELAVASSPSAPPSEDCVADYLDSSTAPPTPHTRFSFWDSALGGFQVHRPPPPPPAAAPTPPNPIGGPMLDVSVTGGAGTGGNTVIGTEGATGPPIPINKTDLAVGQRWRIEMWDSPGDSGPAQHEGFPGTAANPIPITNYRFNLDFRSDLLFWTNYAGQPGATNDAGCKLYSRLLTNSWAIRISYRFDPPTAPSAGPPPVAAAPGASHQVTQTITMAVDATANPAIQPAEGSGLQVRGPTALQTIAVDART